MAFRCVRPRMFFLAVIAIHHMAGGTTRGAVIPWVIVGAHKPRMGVIQSSLGHIQNGNSHSTARSFASIGLLDIGSAWFF